MKFIQLIKLIIKHNPFKISLIGVFIALFIILSFINPIKTIQADRYIRISPKVVYIQNSDGETIIQNAKVYYKDGFAYSDKNTFGYIIFFSMIGVLILFLAMALSEDDDVNFDFVYCRTLLRQNDVTMISAGNGEFVYLLDNKAIFVSKYASLSPRELSPFIKSYIESPQNYYIYTTRDDIRMDIINDIIDSNS